MALRRALTATWPARNALSLLQLPQCLCAHETVPPLSPPTDHYLLSSGSLVSYPVTSTSFETSPTLSHSDDSSRDSPNYLEPFEYTSDMECDFRRIDLKADEVHRLEDNGTQPSSSMESAGLPPSAHADSPLARIDSPPVHTDSPPPTPLHQKQKYWVVFQGREPGIYDCMYVFLPNIKWTYTHVRFQGPRIFPDQWIQRQLSTNLHQPRSRQRRVAHLYAGWSVP